MENSTSFDFDCLNNDNLIKTLLFSVLIIVIIMFLYKNWMNFKQDNQDTIIFYVADWCPNCKKIKSFINKCKKQKNINIVIKKPEDMCNREKQLIKGFPTALRLSDNSMAEGEEEIKKLVKQTLAMSNIENFETSKNNSITFYTASWCEHCKFLIDYIPLVLNSLKTKQINVVIRTWDEMTKTEKVDISGFPTAKININNNEYYAIGENEIRKNITNILNNNIETFTASNDTIQFYIAEWCGHSQRLIPYIEDYKKQQNTVNVEIIYDKDMPKDLNITGFPTAIRKSDNKRAVGVPEILNLMKETRENNNKDQVIPDIKNNNSNKIMVFLADWCGHCQNFKPQLLEIMKTNKNIELVNSNDIKPEFQKHIQGFPTALRVSDEKVAVGATEIIKLINDKEEVKYEITNEVKQDIKHEVKQEVIQDGKQEVKHENNKNTIIVFLADWCGHCQNFKPKLSEIMKTNKNIELVDSNNISPELQKYIQGFPAALRVSDEKVAVGAPEILKLINDNQNKSNYIFIYSNNCKYSNMIKPKWLDLKLKAIDNKLNVNLLDYESEELQKLPDNYRKQLAGFPTLFINDEKYEGYDEIENYLDNML
jgi:thiol-disulfide isomerase/thioredoxin